MPMKNIEFLQDFDAYKAGEHVLAPDQVACDAIACGAAVPSVQAIAEPAPAKPASKAK
jgi:hypothetical protein